MSRLSSKTQRSLFLSALFFAIACVVIFLAVLVDSTCTSNNISIGYLEYATDSRVCGELIFIWGVETPVLLIPAYMIVSFFEYIGLHHTLAAFLNSLLWVTIFVVGSYFLSDSISAGKRRLTIISVGVIVALLIFSSIFMYEPLGHEIMDWSSRCSELRTELRTKNYGSCVAYQAHIVNAEDALLSASEIPGCQSLAAIDAYGMIDTLEDIKNTNRTSELNYVLAQCLCKSAESSEVQSFLESNEVRDIRGILVGPRINDSVVICRE